MQRYGLYVLVLSFASGVLLRSLFSIGLPSVLWLLGLALLLLVFALRYRSQYLSFLRYAALGLTCLAVGILRMDVAVGKETSPRLEPQVGQTISLTGVVTREPDVRRTSQHIYLDMPNESRHLLVMTDRYRRISYGDKLTVTGQLELPESFSTDLGRTFNYPGYLAARNVGYLLRYPDAVETVATKQGNPVLAHILLAKQAFQSSLRSVLPAPSVHLAEGILLGEKQALGDRWEELFRRTGVIHIVVLSGFNVMLVVAFLLVTLSYVTGVRGRVIGGLLGITVFVLLVGLAPSVTRAGLMAGMVVLAFGLGRSYAILRALVLAGGIMLLANPYVLLYDPGFQLSFMATLGLIVVAPAFEERLTLAPTTLGIRSYLVATLVTQLAVLPLLLYHIGEISLVAVAANLLVLPIVAAAMGLAFATGLLAFVTPMGAQLLAFVTDLSLRYILVVVEWLGSWSVAAFAVPPVPAWSIVLMYGVMGYWWYRRTHRDTVSLPVPKTSTAATVDVSHWTIDEVVDSKTGATRRVAPVARSIFHP